MVRFFALPLVLVGAAALWVPTAMRDIAATVEVKTVRVNARCQGNRDRYTVDPTELRIRQDDEVEWILENDQPEAIEITPKVSDRWPFSNARHRGARANRARARNMRPAQRGRYSYNITVVCGEDDEWVIDPDIVIGEEASGDNVEP